MKLEVEACVRRLAVAPFGVLGTLDVQHGVHQIPVVFATYDDVLVIPVDRVKPKQTTALRRIANLESDARASLLVDHRTADWDDLWWVRADLRFGAQIEPNVEWMDRLASKYPAYRDRDTVASLLELHIHRLSGWSASPDDYLAGR